MADKRFFLAAGPFSLGRLLFEVGLGDDVGDQAHDMGQRFTGVAALDAAGPDQISFFHNRQYGQALARTGAGAVLIHAREAHRVPENSLAVIVADPYRAFGQLASLFHPVHTERGQTSVHPTAFVDPSAMLDPGVHIGPFACIGERVSVGAGSVVGGHCLIEAGVEMGENCVLEGHCTLSHALIGHGVYVKSGARIGQGGFGWALDHSSQLDHQRIPQLGRVVIGDHVEIGANTTIDRGAGPDTVIGPGTVIDNQCQIAHNVRMGRGCVVAGHSAIAGSATLEDGVLIGGCCAVLGHLTVGAGTQVHAKSSVTKSCPAGSVLRGVPARDHRLYLREEAAQRLKDRKGAQDALDKERHQTYG